MLQQRSKEIGLETILSFRSLPSVYHWTNFHSSFCMSKCSVHYVSVHIESRFWDYAQDGVHNLTFLMNIITLGEYWDFLADR